MRVIVRVIVRVALIGLSFLITGPAFGEDLVFCRPNNMVSAQAYIAEQKGFFAAQGLSVSFGTGTNAKICFDALLSGRADVAMGAESAFVYLTRQESDARLISFAGSNPETAIFYRKDRGINTEADLRGKRIGYLPGSCSVPYLALILERNAIPWSAAILTPLQPPALSAALAGGAVDAISIWEPWGENARRLLGEKSGVFRDPSLYSYTTALISTATIIKKRSGDLQKVVRALIQTEQFMKDNPNEAIDILSKAIALDASIIRSLWSKYSFRLEVRSAQLDILKSDFRILKKVDPGFADVVEPNFLTFVDFSILRIVDSSRVQLDARD